MAVCDVVLVDESKNILEDKFKCWQKVFKKTRLKINKVKFTCHFDCEN